MHVTAVAVAGRRVIYFEIVYESSFRVYIICGRVISYYVIILYSLADNEDEVADSANYPKSDSKKI